MADFEQPLFGCLSDLFSCLIVSFIPGGICFIQASAVNRATGEGMVIPFILPCLAACIGAAINRGKLRDHYKLNGSFVIDCLLHWFCSCCAVTQEYREVNTREGSKK
jgi:Cys-rich protein (TIGR01571 family)